MIADDLAEIKTLGMMKDMPEIEAELQIRLGGAKADDAGDDQLLGEALRLTYDQYKKYMWGY